MTEDQVRVLANRVIAPSLQDWGFETSEVQAGQDHSGEDALFVTLHFKPGSKMAKGSDYTSALMELWSALKEKGENRFPYFEYEYPGDERPFTDAEASDA